MAYYHLYLDESKISRNGQQVYCVAGIVVLHQHLSDFRRSLAKLKYSIWSEADSFQTAPKDRILHEAEIRSGNRSVLERYPYYNVFHDMEGKERFFEELRKLIVNNKLNVIGSIVDLTSLQNAYLSRQNSYTGYYTALSSIMENYAHFLKHINGTGDIIFESRKNNASDVLDVRTRKIFYKILTHGTTAYDAGELQNVITSVRFFGKHENEAGLQIADFIPRPLLLHYVGIKQSKPSIYQTVRKARYHGMIAVPTSYDFEKFGVTIIK